MEDNLYNLLEKLYQTERKNQSHDQKTLEKKGYKNEFHTAKASKLIKKASNKSTNVKLWKKRLKVAKQLKTTTQKEISKCESKIKQYSPKIKTQLPINEIIQDFKSLQQNK